MEATTFMKILVLNMLLSVAVHADADTVPPPPSNIDSPPTDSPAPSSIDSPPPLPVPEISPPPAPLLPQTPPLPLFPPPLLPQTPPLPQFPPPEVDLVPPPPLSCREKCFMQCVEKSGFSRMFCLAKCMVMCKISPFDKAGYACTRDCVMNNLHHQPNTKSLDGLVNSCYNKCTQQI